MTGSRFADNAHLLKIIDKIVSRVGRRIDESSPMVDARLPDGSRFHAIVPPIAVRGAAVTIRKFARELWTLEDLVRSGTVSDPDGCRLADAVRGRRNLVVSGGAGTGKTTLLGVLTRLVPPTDRIITIEDAA